MKTKTKTNMEEILCQDYMICVHSKVRMARGELSMFLSDALFALCIKK